METNLENLINAAFANDTEEDRYRRAKMSIYSPDVRFLVSKRDVIGAFAKWATKQSPYAHPDDLEKVIRDFDDHMDIYFKDGSEAILDYRWFTLLKLEDFIKGNLKTIPEFLAWNERKNKRQGMGFTSRADIGKERDPDDDFIDLDALYCNVAHDIYNDAVQLMTKEDFIKYSQPQKHGN